jgi:DNA polymerase-3 subunit gamma/tau
MVARLLLPASDADDSGMRARLDQLERRIASGAVVGHEAPAAGHPIAAPQDAPTPATRQAGPAVVEPVKQVERVEPVEPVEPEAGEPPAAAPPPPRRISEVAPSTAAAEPRPKPPTRPAARPRADSAPAAPVAEAAPAAASAPVTSLPLEQFVSMWPAVVEAVKTYGKVAWMTFQTSTPVSLSNGVLAVGISESGPLNNAKSSGHDERLRLAVIDVLKTDVRIDLVLTPDRTGLPAATATGSTTGPASTPDTSSASAEVDTPSIDDANADDAVGVDLALRELGATQIGEIDH